MDTIYRALRFFKDDRGLIAVWLSIIAVSVVLGLLQAWPTAVLVDAVLTRTPHESWVHRLFLAPLPDNMLAQVIGVTLIGMSMKVVQDALGWLKRRVNRRVELNGMFRARCALYEKLQELGPAYQKTQLQGDSIYRVSTDVEGPRIILCVLIDGLVAAVTLLVMGAILFTRNIVLTGVAMSVVPALVALNWHYAPQVKRRTIRSKEADTSYTNALIRSISGIAVVQSFCRQPFEYDRFRSGASNSAESWQSVVRAETSYNFWVQTVFSVAGAIIFGYGGYLVYRDQFVHPVAYGFTCGDIMVFMTYLGGLWDPLSRLTGIDVALKPGVAGAERVFQVLDRQPATADGAHARALPVASRAIELDCVHFAYPGGAEVLRGVSARVEPGQFVAFVGPSGTGKSTLLSLLPRFYDPKDGAVRLDGDDLRELKLDDLRRHFALASQESVMLPASVRENIAYGKPDATQAEIEAAARRSGAADFIEQMEAKYETEASENGQNLSGGQRQRIAVARALLSEAPILVLDEPTSALDSSHERSVMDALEAERGKRTVVLVTHRLRTVVQCDTIFVLDKGVLVEQGSHSALMEKKGLYHLLFMAEAEQQKL